MRTRQLSRFPFLLLVLLLLTSSTVHGQALEQVDPDEAGMSSERLERLASGLSSYIERGVIPGSVTLILRDGKVVYESALGMQDREAGAPMQMDAMFRIASQTKAIVSTAIMILQEQGKLNIQDPVGKYLPEWGQTTVAQATEDGYEIVPARRAIRIRDLLTHTSGVGWGTGPAKALWEEKDMRFWYLADREEGIREFVRELATLPMDAHPGEKYVYGLSIDVLGAVVEVASGVPLDRFLETELFEPLAMTDTYFFVPAEKASRMAVVYEATPEGLKRQTDEGHWHGQGHYVEGPRRTFGGGAGLVSTARDYARFLQMILNGGALDGARVLSPTTVDLMLSNHTGTIPFGPGRAMGLGFGIVTDLGAYGKASSLGEFDWGGAYHSRFFVSPKHRLVVVYMTQTMISVGGVDDFDKLNSLVYQAVVE
ncbi:MAG: serine hydrolase [Bacteroidetes bacterium]|nr:serine hydrolase [Bacteroidota bacterium]